MVSSPQKSVAKSRNWFELISGLIFIILHLVLQFDTAALGLVKTVTLEVFMLTW